MTLDASAHGVEQTAQLHACVAHEAQQSRKLLEFSSRSWISGLRQTGDLPLQPQTIYVECQHVGIAIDDLRERTLRSATRHRIVVGQSRDERLRPPAKMIGATDRAVMGGRVSLAS